jgi:serine/threonine protein kinase
MGCSSSDIGSGVKNASFHDKYCLGQKIGAGSFAQVYLATTIDNQPGSEKAVKVIGLRGARNAEIDYMLSAAHREETTWRTVGRHANCVHLCQVFYCDSFCFMVMEKCDCDLRVHLEGMASITERSLGYIFLQMLKGIAHIHFVKIVHRDIKPDNWLVGGNNGQTVKLCDFGLAAPLGKQSELRGVCGSAPFMSPEMLKGIPYNEKVDIWSFAVTCYCLLLGDFPYSPKANSPRRYDAASLKMAIAGGKSIAFEPVDPFISSASYSPSALSFLKALLIPQHELRGSASEALGMEYMTATSKNRHAHSVLLPSLRTTLYYARQNGVFRVNDLSHKTSLDVMLDRWQAEKLGMQIGCNQQTDQLREGEYDDSQLKLGHDEKSEESALSDTSNDLESKEDENDENLSTICESSGSPTPRTTVTESQYSALRMESLSSALRMAISL